MSWLADFFYPVGAPERLGDVLDECAYLAAEGAGSYEEILQWPNSRRQNVLEYVNKKYERRDSELNYLIETLQKMLTGK